MPPIACWTRRSPFQVAMDQFAMGINFQIPARTMQPKRAELNDYVGRLSYLLQHGRHVADVAVLYPIASLHAAVPQCRRRPVPAGAKAASLRRSWKRLTRARAASRFGIDYQDIGEALFRGLRVDYTYLHPEVLVERCTVDGNKLILNNRENREEYSVLILPAGDTLSAAAAAKIKEFYDARRDGDRHRPAAHAVRGVRQGQGSAAGYRRRLRRLAGRALEGGRPARAGPA